MQTDVILLCAGSGQRMKANFNKIFLPLDFAGKTVLDYSLHNFIIHPEIRFVQPVISKKDAAQWTRWLKAITFSSNNKLLPPVFGGETRQDSVYNGLNAYQNKAAPKAPDFVLIHDAARCLLPLAIIDNCLLSLKEGRACLPVLPVQDTLRQQDKKQALSNHLGILVDRGDYQLAQTPQAFPFTKIQETHQLAKIQHWKATDDAELYQKAGHKIYTVPGSPINFKLTTPDDLLLAQAVVNYSKHNE